MIIVHDETRKEDYQLPEAPIHVLSVISLHRIVPEESLLSSRQSSS